MPKTQNILFIMCDQLRADYLGCFGNRRIRTPNIDWLASVGTRFSNAYVQAPTCGPSRMSFYTGRYVASHGASWNEIPLNIGVETIGDILAPAGVRTVVIGKTHMCPDLRGIARVAGNNDSMVGNYVRTWGFEQLYRDDGLHPMQIVSSEYEYNAWLRRKGYLSQNPWEDYANAVENPDGEILSGWALRNTKWPARIPDEASETAFLTNKAVEFMKAGHTKPWCLHLSYIKPHWPYVTSKPYHDMYSADDVPAAIRHTDERKDEHPVVEAYRRHRESIVFSDDDVRRTVIPTYMGMVTQIDTHLGELFRVMKETALLDNTMIVFTADHGDYLGDHWLGEKELFYDSATRFPLIIYDPQSAILEGQMRDDIVQAIDLLPTFADVLDIPIPDWTLEGRTLFPFVREAQPRTVENAAICELDYTFRPARAALGLDIYSAKAWMVRTPRWKYNHFLGFTPQLFDLQEDPEELVDLGRDQGYSAVRSEMKSHLFDWFSNLKSRTTVSRERANSMMGIADKLHMPIGVW